MAARKGSSVFRIQRLECRCPAVRPSHDGDPASVDEGQSRKVAFRVICIGNPLPEDIGGITPGIGADARQATGPETVHLQGHISPARKPLCPAVVPLGRDPPAAVEENNGGKRTDAVRFFQPPRQAQGAAAKRAMAAELWKETVFGSLGLSTFPGSGACAQETKERVRTGMTVCSRMNPSYADLISPP